MVSSVPKNSAILASSCLCRSAQAAGSQDRGVFRHRGHAEAVRIQRVFGGLNHVGMIGQPQIIIGAKIQYLAAVGQGDFRRLR
jgi:hypothetical protein